MNSILAIPKNFVSATVTCLNQPAIKSGIKDVAGFTTFAFGMFELCDLYQMNQGCNKNTTSTLDKVIVGCAKVSVILSASVSRIGIAIITALGEIIKYDPGFGPNTIFAVNPWHPRHVVSIAAVVLALPIVTQTICKAIASRRQTDDKIRVMTIFNTFTSRPALHLGNQLFRVLLTV